MHKPGLCTEGIQTNLHIGKCSVQVIFTLVPGYGVGAMPRRSYPRLLGPGLILAAGFLKHRRWFTKNRFATMDLTTRPLARCLSHALLFLALLAQICRLPFNSAFSSWRSFLSATAALRRTLRNDTPSALLTGGLECSVSVRSHAFTSERTTAAVVATVGAMCHYKPPATANGATLRLSVPTTLETKDGRKKHVQPSMQVASAL